MSLPSSVLADREVLYFVHAEDCEACAAARPELERFISKHPAVMVIGLAAGGPIVERLGVKIRATPTYVFRRGEAFVKVEGALKATDLERFLKKAGATL